MIPYSRPKRSDLYTRFEYHTLHSGKYPHSPYMAVPPRARSSRAATAEKCTKKRDARATLFCLSKPIALLPFSFPSSSSLRKLQRTWFSLNFWSNDQLTKKKDRILIKDLISTKWKYILKKRQGWFYSLPDCKISLASFVLYFGFPYTYPLVF